MRCVLLLGVLSLLLAFVTSKILIESPQNLKFFFRKKYGDNGLPYSIANYGNVPYGKTLIGQIGVPTVLQDCIYDDEGWSNNTGKIILVQRNDCKFTQKSLNVQKQGGKMAVVMDNVAESPGDIIMIDDGHGWDVHIPTVLITKQDGERILELVIKNQTVSLRVTFEEIIRDTANVILWVDSASHQNYEFLRLFQPYYERIKTSINLTIGYSVMPCSYCLETDCFYDKKYCRNIVNKGMVDELGRAVILEELRQYFAFQFYPELWWKYMLQFDDNCISYIVLRECSVKIMQKLGMDLQKIGSAIIQSFEATDNEVLNNLSSFRTANALYYSPAVLVNGIVHRGTMQPIDIFEMICNSFNTPPGGCNIDTPNQPISVWTWVLFATVSFFLFIICVMVCYRRIVRRRISQKINLHVNELVNQYITMYQNEKFTAEPAEATK